ncbi:MAG: hypothetical protein ABIG69_11115 [Bacteroidota bacterium]
MKNKFQTKFNAPLYSVSAMHVANDNSSRVLQQPLASCRLLRK